MDIVTLFCDIDDFCSVFGPAWRRRLLASGACRRRKPGEQRRPARRTHVRPNAEGVDRRRGGGLVDRPHR